MPLISHNPVISQLSPRLDPVHADPDGLRVYSLAVHRFPGDWGGDPRPEGALPTTWHTTLG